jgi:hypothetical protein
MAKRKYYRVFKHVVEEYGIMANSKKEAENNDLEDPSTVRVVKVTSERDPKHDEHLTHL